MYHPEASLTPEHTGLRQSAFSVHLSLLIMWFIALGGGGGHYSIFRGRASFRQQVLTQRGYQACDLRSSEPCGGRWGGSLSFCCGLIIYFNPARRRAENFITCSYGTVLEVNYLFHAGAAQNYLFKKYSSHPPPPGDWMVPPPYLGNNLLLNTLHQYTFFSAKQCGT